MGAINPYKKYKKLYTFGCSFTNGFQTRHLGTWGTLLANKLGCDHDFHAHSGGSNRSIMMAVLNFCERNNTEDICIGIQWTELTRKDFWSPNSALYFTFEPSALMETDWVNPHYDVKPFQKNKELFLDIWYDRRENILCTLQYMFLLQGYLKGKNIDYVMFEGLGSILDNYYPSTEIEEFLKISGGGFHGDLTLLVDKIKMKVFDDPAFFKKYGDMKNFMKTHPLFDSKANGDHPNIEFCDWWTTEMYDYLKSVNQKKLI